MGTPYAVYSLSRGALPAGMSDNYHYDKYRNEGYRALTPITQLWLRLSPLSVVKRRQMRAIHPFVRMYLKTHL